MSLSVFIVPFFVCEINLNNNNLQNQLYVHNTLQQEGWYYCMGHMALSQEEHKIIAQKSMAYESICVGGHFLVPSPW